MYHPPPPPPLLLSVALHGQIYLSISFLRQFSICRQLAATASWKSINLSIYLSIRIIFLIYLSCFLPILWIYLFRSLAICLFIHFPKYKIRVGRFFVCTYRVSCFTRYRNNKALYNWSPCRYSALLYSTDFFHCQKILSLKFIYLFSKTIEINRL